MEPKSYKLLYIYIYTLSKIKYSLFDNIIYNSYMLNFLQGYILLLVQAHRPDLRPPQCLSITHDCEGVSTSQAAMLFSGLYLLALGTGGVKATLPSLGADQFDERDPKEARQMSSYFNWFLFSLTIGSILGTTLVVWISTNKGWDWAFAVCSIALFLSVIFICLGKPFYRNNIPKGSPLLRFARVIITKCLLNII